MAMKLDRNSGAIVCQHVAAMLYPIRRAVRDLGVAPEDSGWQFLCDSGENKDPEQAQIWSIGHVIEAEPTLEQWLDHDPGTKIVRLSGDWIEDKQT
jgi:hypothetical protein